MPKAEKEIRSRFRSQPFHGIIGVRSFIIHPQMQSEIQDLRNLGLARMR